MDTQCWNCSGAPNTTNYVLKDLWSKAQINALDRLEPKQCIEQYATAIQTERRNLLLVTSDDRFNQSDQFIVYDSEYTKTNITNRNTYWTFLFEAADAEKYGSAILAYAWICSRRGSICSTQIETIRDESNNWRIGNWQNFDKRYRVEYCLAEKALPRCRLHFNLSIAIVVIILNFCKSFEAATCTALSPLR